MKKIIWFYTFISFLVAGTAFAQEVTSYKVDDPIETVSDQIEYQDESVPAQTETASNQKESISDQDETVSNQALNSVKYDGLASDEPLTVPPQQDPEAHKDAVKDEIIEPANIYPQEIPQYEDPSQNPAYASRTEPYDEIKSETNQNTLTQDEIQPEASVFGWNSGLGIFAGIGPAFDLRDHAAGYSARLGMNVHGRYFGVSFEATWNMLWVTNGAKRSDHREAAYRATNSGLLMLLDGFFPVTRQFVITVAGGAGLGCRYEIIFSDRDLTERDVSWLARLQVGSLWLFENHLTLGLNLEFNFGNYIDHYAHWWSDDKTDVSLGLVFSFSYLYMKEF